MSRSHSRSASVVEGVSDVTDGDLRVNHELGCNSGLNGGEVTHDGGALSLVMRWAAKTSMWRSSRTSSFIRRRFRILQRRRAIGSTLCALAIGMGFLSASTPAGATPHWSSVATNSGGHKVIDNFLYSVSCVSIDSCVAAGWRGTLHFTATLIESWNGATWSVVPSPNDTTNDAFEAVSCVSSTFCMAVGSTRRHSLVESWNGSRWSIVASPGKNHSVLDAVSCVSTNFCTAAGYRGQPESSLIESWDGTSWSIAPSPEIDGRNLLGGVSCVSAEFCTAVGWTNTQTLIESWDGASWSIVLSPNSGTYPLLNAVSCTSGTSCVAVGWTYEGSLIELWDGTSWSIVPSPNSGGGPNFLYGVSCFTASSCTATGWYGTENLIESWDGTTWSIVASPDYGFVSANQLSSVSCPSANFCATVGAYVTSGGVNQTLIESWANSAWSIVPSPNHE